MMLAHEFKIKGEARIEEVKAKGKLFQSENFGVSILKQEVKGTSRFAFVISKKISKLAVHRNRINRSMNEGVRRSLKNVPQSFDFVFLAKKSIARKTTEEIIKEVERFLFSLKL